MIKVELHAHTSDDPADRVPHSTRELIDHAARLGYGALAITLHDRQLDLAPHAAYARERGVTLLSGVERTIGRVHVLLIEFPAADALAVRSFEDVRRLRARREGLVVVPHPFYPISSAMGELLDAHADWIDAVEINAMHTLRIDFNRRARDWAARFGKPLVGNSDLHRLAQMGTTWSDVDVAPGTGPAAICEAVRQGRVTARSSPLTWHRAGWLFGLMVLGGIRGGTDHTGGPR
jgi:predicted metal-dependent phosphoesterase TrpH